MYMKMNKNKRYVLILFLFFLLLFTIFKGVSAEKSNIIVEFYFADNCPHCEEKFFIIEKIEDLYKNNITLKRFSIENSSNKKNFFNYGFTSTPGVVVKNQSYHNYSIITYEYITVENLKNQINYHLSGNYSKKNIIDNEKRFCIGTFFGEFCIDTKDWSLPLLTVVLGAVDSVNPCSFFVFLFLLSILLHTKSRKRMLLVGSVFIFFSGFIYFLLMIAILFFFLAIDQQLSISIIAGIVAMTFGGFNIFNFFFFKKGFSTEISDKNKSKLFKKMGKIVRMKSVIPLIIATVILAISANSVELLCSFNIPFIYTSLLISYNLNIINYYLYIVLYNIIYVLPLLILVFVVAATFGRWKLTEWQGRKLKLFSGIMMFMLGFFLIFLKGILMNIFLVFLILIFSMVATIIVSYLFKNVYRIRK